jgi:hypothetical protein
MTTTFGGVSLPAASKISESPQVALTDTLLLSGKHSIQTNPNMGFGAAYRCFGTWAQYQAILGLVGQSGTLVTEQTSYTLCYIASIKTLESDNPGYFYFDVEFKRETVT